jgi:hypothetical protein
MQLVFNEQMEDNQSYKIIFGDKFIKIVKNKMNLKMRFKLYSFQTDTFLAQNLQFNQNSDRFQPVVKT